MTHPQFRIDTLHERSREFANQIDRTRRLAGPSWPTGHLLRLMRRRAAHSHPSSEVLAAA